MIGRLVANPPPLDAFIRDAFPDAWDRSPAFKLIEIRPEDIGVIRMAPRMFRAEAQRAVDAHTWSNRPIPPSIEAEVVSVVDRVVPR